MDKILGAFPLGFLIRSTLSGVFFVITFAFAGSNFVEFDSGKFIKIGLPLALIPSWGSYFLTVALVSNWRFFSVLQHIDRISPATKI